MWSTPDEEAWNVVHCILLVIWLNRSVYIKAVNQELLSIKIWNSFFVQKAGKWRKKSADFPILENYFINGIRGPVFLSFTEQIFLAYKRVFPN